MKVKQRSRLLMLAALLSSAVISGCGSSSKNTVSTTEATFYGHSVIFANHSTLYTSGYNGYGQLGNGTLDNGSIFGQVSTETGMNKVGGFAAGANHTVAYSGNTVWTWGSNFQGRLGVGDTAVSTSGGSAFSSHPLAVTMPDAVRGVAAGWKHSAAIVGAQGNVYAWGSDAYGQLGNNRITNASNTSLTYYSTPVAVQVQDGSQLSHVTRVAAGGSHTLALSEETDGTTRVWAWGLNDFGQLGVPGSTYIPYAAPVTALADEITKDVVAAGLLPAETSVTSGVLPTGVTIKDVAAAGSFSLALLQSGFDFLDGTVWGWGFNGYGQLGRGAGANGTPAKVLTVDGTPLKGVTRVSAGIMHGLALKKNGTTGKGEVWAWGFNEKGQLGRGFTSTFASSAEKTSVLDALIQKSQFGVQDIYAFGTQSFAKIDGVWYGWGDNGWGQLGQDVPKTSVAYYLTPVQLRGVPVASP